MAVRFSMLVLTTLLAIGVWTRGAEASDHPDPRRATAADVEKYIDNNPWWQKRRPPDIDKLLREQEKKVKGNKFTFAVVGDSYGKESVLVPLLKAAEKAGAVLFVDVGDIVGHGTPWSDEKGSNRSWANTAKVTDPFFRRLPHLPTRGDHEQEGPGGEIKDLKAQQVAFNRFWGLKNSYNAWRFKNCLFLTMEPERNTREEWAWLKKQLEAASKDAGIQHVFISRHGPFYDIGKTGRGIRKPYDRNDFETRFGGYKVTATFGGHQHAYYRTVRDDISHIAVLACGAGHYGQKYRDRARLADSFFYIAGGSKREGPAPKALPGMPLPQKGQAMFRVNGRDEDLAKWGIDTLYGNFICMVEIDGPRATHWLQFKDGKKRLGEIALKPLPQAKALKR